MPSSSRDAGAVRPVEERASAAASKGTIDGRGYRAEQCGSAASSPVCLNCGLWHPISGGHITKVHGHNCPFQKLLGQLESQEICEYSYRATCAKLQLVWLIEGHFSTTIFVPSGGARSGCLNRYPHPRTLMKKSCAELLSGHRPHRHLFRPTEILRHVRRRPTHHRRQTRRTRRSGKTSPLAHA